MKEIKYYVLWTKDSWLITEYKQKFLDKLKQSLYTCVEKEILSKNHLEILMSKNAEWFLLNPEISSHILYSLIFENDSKKEILQNQIDIFESEWINSEKLIMNQGKYIKGTNIRLSEIHNNNYAQFNSHPDHATTGGQLGWGIKDKSEWLDLYARSFDLLKKIDTGIYDELNQMITRVVPFGTAQDVHNSASYKECIGHIYLWYTINTDFPEIHILEAIIHESSHNKLNLLMHSDPILLNKREEKYYSAIRPDARPLMWVFLWYHAFAPTIYILMKAYTDWYLWVNDIWKEKLVLFYFKTRFLQKVIKKHAHFTDLGKEVSGEIDYVIELMTQQLGLLNIDSHTLKNAQNKAKEHFLEVNHKYPYLCY